MSDENTTAETTSTEVATTNPNGTAVSTNTEMDSMFNNLAGGSKYIGRVQLYSKGKAIDKQLIKSGHWGSPERGDKIVDLGRNPDFLVLARRAKALDLSDVENISQSYDMNSAEFKRIQNESEVQDSSCSYGISFLLYSRQTESYLEYFANGKTSRPASKDLFGFLPVDGDLANLNAVTFDSEVIETKRFTWLGPVFGKCSTPIEGMNVEIAAQQIQKFLNPPASQSGEAVSEDEQAAMSTRAR